MVAVAVGAVVVAARSGESPRPVAAAPTTTTPPTTVPVEPVAAAIAPEPIRDPRRGNGEAVTFAFGGDVHFEAGLRRAVLSDPGGGFLAPIAETLATADVAMVNLEAPVTERDEPVADHEFVFRAPAQAFAALRGAGVDVVSMANNHAGDHGLGGVADSLAAAQAEGFPVVGLGADAAQAYAPWRTEVRGQRIAVLAATDVFDSAVAGPAQPGTAVTRPADPLLAAVRAARVDADTVVVYLHWGVEGDPCPSPGQQHLARLLVDAGADIVVGTHAHVLQGAGRLDAAFVAYGLGNFIWYNEVGEAGNTGVLRVTATGRDVDAYEWVPARIRGGVPHPLTGPEADAARADWESRRDCTGLAP